jgi:hypothetical protein
VSISDDDMSKTNPEDSVDTF